MNGPSSTIVGRDRELRDLSDFLDRVVSGPNALVLDGSAGIGKTTIWRVGVDEATRRGYHVLTSRGDESEARLSYATLGDLLRDVSEAQLRAISAPLRHALDAALLRTEVPSGSLDQHAVSLAAADALRSLAAAAPLLIAIDDLHWIDGPSSRVLSFALRRLSSEPIGVLVSVRQGSGSNGDPVDIDRAIARTTHLAVGPMLPEALGRIVRDRTGADVPHPVVLRLHHVSGGNPLFALEMARAAVRDGARVQRGDVWSVPEDLQKLLSARLAAVPSAARVPLLAIAATSQPTWELVLEVAGRDERTLDALGRAEETGIIERAGGRARFTHPLLGSTLYLNASTAERRALHGRLAMLTADPEQRARHLALAADGPDAEVAAALESAARQARARGAPDAAAELAEHAGDMTPIDDPAGLRRRRLVAAEYLFDGGDAGGARRVLGQTIASSPPGRERAEMLYTLASMSWMNLIEGVRTPCEQALAEAGDDPRLLSGLHTDLAWVAFYLGDLDEALEHARESAEWAQAPVGAAVRSDALATLALFRFLHGDPNDALMAEAIDLQDEALTQVPWTIPGVYTTPRVMLGLQLMWSLRLDEARTIFEQEIAEFDRHAMYTVRQEVVGYLAEVEARAGNGTRSAQHAAELANIVEETGQLNTWTDAVLFYQGWAAALLGEVDAARRMATDGVRLAMAQDARFDAAANSTVLGFLDVSLAEYGRAARDLEAAIRFYEQMNAAEPAIQMGVPDFIEASVALGRIPEAERWIEHLEARASAGGGRWATATAARGRALIAAAHGDLAAAEWAAEQSASTLEDLGLPFEAARSRLILGQVHRRAKKKRVAREQLESARDTFASLGAVLWADRARSELARIGGRPPTPFELTQTEQDVAELVAQGHTNQETADALFVSLSTVQANLKRVYQKLGVRSRTELAARMSRIEAPEQLAGPP